ncbi:PAS domain S-box protein [Pseudanabaena sp. UWO311]|uniref:PAS domain-containing hybrid sensor histidine kinase/response regulator n=1 Tax=Pseudanabaena sp. UWO311 TaxID=2487337 RepID=UPI00115895FA|nr:PAS domain S-box protein [Pseudanabaena sp. UWO311]TYQ24471.1 PAS domain S-box protein [Pseudanabaena sp. UWO311]
MFKTNKIVYGYAIALGITFVGSSVGLLVGNNYHQNATQKMQGSAEDRKFLNTLQVDILYNRPAKQLSPYLADPDGFKRESGKLLDRIQKILTALETYNSSGTTTSIEGLQPLLAEYEMVVKKFQKEANLEIAQLTPLTESPKNLTAAELRLVKFVKNKDFVKFIEFPDRLLPFVQLADLQTEKAESELAYSKTIRNSIVAGSVFLSAAISVLFAIFASRAIASEQAAINQKLRDQLTEREQAELQLRESEQRYVNLNTAAPVGIFRTDAEGNSIYINQRCCEMLGLSPESTTGKSWQQALHPDDREYVIAEQIRTRRKNLPFHLEYRILRPDGSVIWVLGNAVAEKDNNGQIIGYVGTITDISNQKRSEEALQKSESHSRALISAMPDIIFRMNQEGVYLEFLASPNFNVLGNLSEMVGTNVFDILSLEAAKQRLKSVQQVIHTGSIQVYEQELEIDGITQIEEVRIVPYSETEVLGLVRNISDRKQAELALAKSEAQSRAILSAIPDLMFRVGSDGIYREFYIAYRDFAVIPQGNDLTGRSLSEMLPPDVFERHMHHLQKSLETGEVQVYEQSFPIGDRLQYDEVRVIKIGEDEALFIIRDISDRKQAEQALAKSEAQSRAILSAIPDLMFRVGTDGVYREVITQYQDFALFPLDLNLVGRSMVEMLPAELADRQFHYLRKAIETGKLQIYEQNIQIGDSFQDEEVRVIKSGEDEALFMIRDISDRKQTELALQNLIAGTAATTGKDFFPALVTHIAKALNTSHSLVTELIDGELNSLAFWANGELQPAFSFNIANTPCEKALQHGTFYCDSFVQQMFPQHRDLAEMDAYSYLGISLKDINGQAIGNLCILDEKTIQNPQRAEQVLKVFAARATAELERQRTNNMLVELNQQLESKVQKRTVELQKLSERLTLSLRSGAIGCWEWNIAEQKLFWDERMYELYGVTQDTDFQLNHESWAAMLHPDDLVATREMGERTLLGEIDMDTEFRVFHRDRSIHFIKNYGTLVRDANGHPHSLIGINFDISDRKQAEARLQHTNQELIRATKLKDEFLANMSHELRTPLNAILGMTEALQEQIYGDINDRQIQALQTVEKSGNHLLELINDILNLAKIEAGQVELNYSSASISCLCASSLNFIKQQAMKKQLQIDMHLQPNLPEMQLDERRIKQVLINILNNAVKFTANGGHIKLEATKLSHVSEHTQEHTQDYLQISITDTGIGISPENIQKLFKPFIQIDSALNRKYEGTGLGLALAKQIIELHGGTIGITSEIGIGSCFTIELPINHIKPDPKLEPHPESNLDSHLELKQTSASKTPLILLAEDNEANIITVASYLEAKAFRLIIAKNGQEAIALTKSAQPDLILMDIQMPVMDGLEAIKQIRLDPQFVDTPIIALTALAMTGDRQKCMDAGANEYITKPIKLKDLSQTIRSFMNS